MKILSTSREGLGLADERLWRVPSLEVVAAVQLFRERAARDLSADESAAVEEVCRRLDGIPLAIELAASRMESMTATEMRDRLDHRFKLLVRSRRGLERHQTLRQAVSWSYDLLEEPEKALLERCSVFAGGFDVQGARAVAGTEDADEFTILDLLDTLVRKSLEAAAIAVHATVSGSVQLAATSDPRVLGDQPDRSPMASMTTPPSRTPMTNDQAERM